MSELEQCTAIQKFYIDNNNLFTVNEIPELVNLATISFASNSIQGITKNFTVNNIDTLSSM